MTDLLNRIGEGLVSFGSGIPQVEIDARRLANERTELENTATAEALEEQRRQTAQQRQMDELRRVAFSDDKKADAALQQIFAMNPQMANQIIEGMGIRDQASREEASRFAARLRALPFDQRGPVIKERVNALRSQGRDPSDTLSLRDMDERTQNDMLRVYEMAALTARERASVERQGNLPADVRGFTAQIERLNELEAIPESERTPAQQTEIDALRVERGLDPRAGTITSIERQVENPELAQGITDIEADRGESVRFAEQTGADRADRIDASVNTIEKIDANIRNLSGAIQAIDEGAATGAIVSRFTPTLRASTAELENIQRRLGLDVIGSVTFGALSEGELELALATALPTNLEPEALKGWIQSRIEAQTKLRNYLMQQVDWLSQGGDIASFLRNGQGNQNNRIGRFEVEVVE